MGKSSGNFLKKGSKQVNKMNQSIPVYTHPKIYKQAGVYLEGIVESTPIVLNDRLLLIGFKREGAHGTGVVIYDYVTKELIKEIEWKYGLCCALVVNNQIMLFGSSEWDKSNEIYSAIVDKNYSIGNLNLVLQAFKGQSFYNSSVTLGPNGNKYIMAYEVREPNTVNFSIRFLESEDLIQWKKIGILYRPDIYAACPTIRFSNGWYYIIYLQHQVGYVECISRTKDFKNFEEFSGNDVYGPDIQVLSSRDYLHEGINNSDIDMVEYKGHTYFVYADGNQHGWDNLRTAVYLGTMEEFFGEFWRD